MNLIVRKYYIKSKFRKKIIFISDIHNKKIGEKWQEIIKNTEPDLVLLGGDLVSRKSKNFKNFENFCQFITKIAPVISGVGNHEQSLPTEKVDEYKEIFEKYGIRQLDNETIEFKEFNLTGYTLPYSVYKSEQGNYKNLYKIKLSDIEKAVGKKQEKYTIMLAHNPNFLKIYSQWGANLVLSGHVHGGVIRLPMVGGLLSPERKFFPKYTLGEYSEGLSKEIVSSGIGKLRLFNPPEVVELNFYT